MGTAGSAHRPLHGLPWRSCSEIAQARASFAGPHLGALHRDALRHLCATATCWLWGSWAC